MKKNIILTINAMLIGMNVNAAGVSLGATRLVFPTNQEQVTVKSYNTDTEGSYLIQSWVSDKEGNKINDFVVTPPLFVQKENSDSVLRVVYVGDKNKLPTDRETIYYFNSKVIPSLSKEQQNIPNALLIATTTNIKLFMRPVDLMDGSLDAYKKITCTYNNSEIIIKNKSPYYMTLIDLQANDNEISDGIMIPPFEEESLTNKNNTKMMKYRFINDYGVKSDQLNCPSGV